MKLIRKEAIEKFIQDYIEDKIPTPVEENLINKLYFLIETESLDLAIKEDLWGLHTVCQNCGSSTNL